MSNVLKNHKIPSIKKSPVVVVLISTYNGAQYLDDLLESLWIQSTNDFQVFVRDDGSNDATIQILERHEARGRLTIFDDDLGNIGVTCSFFRLLWQVEADIYMFCDQDDVWLKDKVLHSVSAMLSAADSPTALHTDLMTVDRTLSVINRSFMRSQGLDVSTRRSLKRICLQNTGVGCTMAINRPLRDLIVKAEVSFNRVVMHDWWVMLVATHLGSVVYLDEPYILYRQHANNVSGAGNSLLSRRKLTLAGFSRLCRYLRRIADQSHHFAQLYGYLLADDEIARLKIVSEVYGPRGFRMLLSAYASGMTFSKLYMNLGAMICVITHCLCGIRKGEDPFEAK